MRKTLVGMALVLTGILFLLLLDYYPFNKKEVSNFEECVQAGNPVMESYPRQCRDGDRLFVEEIDNGVVNPEAGLANPASLFCLEQGGELEVRTDSAGGQFGVCIFSDGSECEEWEFFRGECGRNI